MVTALARATFFNMDAVRLKRVVIKEELFSLTNDTIEAIILGQLLYWQERTRDVDKFIEEERERKKHDGIELNIELQNGWIYKSSKQLVEECMLTISPTSMRRYIQKLIEKGFVQERQNPNDKWDKVIQYRVNIDYIIQELRELGYDGLSGYCLPNLHGESSNVQIEASRIQNEASLPEITTEIYKNKENSKKEKKALEQEFAERIYKLYPSTCPKRNASTGKRPKDKEKIIRLLKTYTQEQIEAVINNEIKTKYGVNYMQNFSTFLNNFPDPNEIDGFSSDGVYKPHLELGRILYSEKLANYVSVQDPTINGGIQDGYTDDNRPDGAVIIFQLYMFKWDAFNKNWIKMRL